jgi:hypothetical protein
MPTIFNFRSNNFDDVVQILNRAKQGLVPTKEELASLAHCFNNSLVGTSKLLHFINPEKFAIWDSRVYRYLTGESPHTYRLNKSEAYLDYLDFCAYLTKQNGFEEIHKSLEKKIGYKMTKMRVVELIMYIKEI